MQNGKRSQTRESVCTGYPQNDKQQPQRAFCLVVGIVSPPKMWRTLYDKSGIITLLFRGRIFTPIYGLLFITIAHLENGSSLTWLDA